MYKTSDSNIYMYPIPHYSRYFISKNGDVGKLSYGNGKSENEIQRFSMVKQDLMNQKWFCRIRDDSNKEKRVNTAKTVVKAFYGDAPFDIKYLNRDTTDMNINNLQYIFDDVKLSKMHLDGYNTEVEVLLVKDIADQYVILRDCHLLTGYFISRDGILFNKEKNQFVIYELDSDIPFHTVIIGGKRYYIHDLVYLAWNYDQLTTIPIKMTPFHKDGNKCNNDIDNLILKSTEEATTHYHDLSMSEDNARATWFEDDAERICKYLQDKKTYREIAAEFGITDATDKNPRYVKFRDFCRKILAKKIFKNISDKYTLPKYSGDDKRYGDHYSPAEKYSEKIIRKVCELLVQGYMPKEVFNMINGEVGLGTIQNIKVGKQYRAIAETIPGMDNIIQTRSVTKLDRETAIEIAEMLSKRYTYAEIADKFGIEPTSKSRAYINFCRTIRKVASGQLYPDIKEKYDLAIGY